MLFQTKVKQWAAYHNEDGKFHTLQPWPLKVEWQGGRPPQKHIMWLCSVSKMEAALELF